ncbi:MAG: TPM domain-containing protein [Bacteroidota bacterium]
MSQRFFSDADLERIKTAVQTAESKTSGEVVPYIVEQSDDYDEADLRSALLLGLVPLTIVLALRVFTNRWIEYDAMELAVATLVCTALGWLAGRYISPLKRLLAGNALMDRRVEQRAEEAFLSEEVFNTRGRTGILVFVSVLEHRVLVVGDSGINAKVQKSEWDAVVQRITEGIRSGRKVEGLIEGLTMCGELLKKHGVARPSDDTNELPNTLRTDG